MYSLRHPVSVNGFMQTRRSDMIHREKYRQLSEMVNKTVSSFMDEVKVVVWRRGLGGQQHPLESMPPVIIHLSKTNILPAVAINGKVKFALEVPLESDLAKAIHHSDKFPDILGSLHKPGLSPSTFALRMLSSRARFMKGLSKL